MTGMPASKPTATRNRLIEKAGQQPGFMWQVDVYQCLKSRICEFIDQRRSDATRSLFECNQGDHRVAVCSVAFGLSKVCTFFLLFLISCEPRHCIRVHLPIKVKCYLIDGSWLSSLFFLVRPLSLSLSLSWNGCAQQAIWDAMCIDYIHTRTHFKSWYRSAKNLKYTETRNGKKPRRCVPHRCSVHSCVIWSG